MKWIELHFYRDNGDGYWIKGSPIAININNIKYIEGKKHCFIHFIDGRFLQVYEDYDEIIEILKEINYDC